MTDTWLQLQESVAPFVMKCSKWKVTTPPLRLSHKSLLSQAAIVGSAFYLVEHGSARKLIVTMAGKSDRGDVHVL